MKFDIIKEKVEKGKCQIFNNWHEFTGVSAEDFLNGVKWLYAAEEGNTGTLRYELGCTKKGEIVRLERRYMECTGQTWFFRMDNGKKWNHSDRASISARDWL